jgi:phosphomannomutase/phosphoglucomutase
MGRIFAIIAAISACMVFLAGGSAYWFSAADAKSAKQEAVTVIANNLAGSLAMQLSTLQASVDGLAQSPDVIAALSSANPELIKATAAKLQTVVPHSLRVRLLLPSVNDLDQTQAPNMGFGDLEMVKTSLTSKPQPVIQGDAEHRHLAITSAVTHDQKVIGVVLASLKPNLLQQIIANTPIQSGFIELKQDQLALASAGQADHQNDDPISVPVQNSRWQINVWAKVGTSLTDIGILLALIVIPALLACLAFFVGYRKFSDFFHQDQSGILKAAKDMLQGKTMGSYPMQLSEMQPIIAAMVQFKRVMDQSGGPSTESADDGRDFFEESFDIDFLEETSPNNSDKIQTAAISLSSMAVTMPSFADMETVLQQPESTTQTEWQTDDLAETIQISMPKSNNWSTDNIASPDATPAPSSPSQQLPTSAPLFREFDILGLAGKNLNEDIITNIGRAFASEARQLQIKTIVVARDGRLSSPALSEALIKGIISTGCDVLDIGLVPTPVLYFVSHHSEGRTGMMVTGGNQPAEFNGLKMVLNGESLSSTQIQHLKTRVDQQFYTQEESGSVDRNTLFSNEYIGIISEDIHIVRPMTVVIDSANGAIGKLGPMLLKTIGCDVVEINCDIDGHFPNHQPNLINPGNLDALIKAVKLNNADLGLAFDGDGERMVMIDSIGRIIWADQQMMLIVRDVLAIKPGSEVIYDPACSSNLPEQIKKRGGFPVLCKSGVTPLHNRLRETGALMACDLSGHFLFNDRWFGFNDALYAAVRMIELLSADMRSSSALFDELPSSINTPELHIPMSDVESRRFIEQFFSLADFPDGDIVNLEGMRVEFPDGWGLIKASNALAGLSLRFEADSSAALGRIQAQFKPVMLQINPDISVPF